MGEKWVLAVDQGTTGSTVLAFDANGTVQRRAYAEFPQIYPKPGWVEHDPDVIWETTLSVIREALKPGDEIAAIGITNQRETTVAWDRHTGKPVYNAIVWQCRRTADICRNLEPHQDLFRSRTGLLTDAYFSGTKAKWILDHVDGARESAENGDLCFGTIDTWLIWKLTHGKVHVTDYTNASRTLMFNIFNKTWDEELLTLLNVPKSMLPKVVDSSSFVGESAVEPLVGVPITGVAGDQQASLFGLHCVRPGLVKNTYGTGCFMMKYEGETEPELKKGLLGTLACDPQGKPAYALEGSVFIAGAAIQWLRDGLGIIQDARETEDLALSLEDNGGVYFVPAFVGLGAPYWDADARGTIVGLTRGSGRAHFARAALEAIAFQSRDVMDVMRGASAFPIEEVRVDGGASKNAFLMQFQADQLGVCVYAGLEAEKTAYGAALLAGMAVAFWNFDLADSKPPGKAYEPQMDKAQKEALYDGWQKAITKARSL